MAERSLGDRVSLALQEQVYSLAASVSQSVDEVIGAIESVVASYEKEANPVYNINVDNPTKSAEEVAREVIDSLNLHGRHRAEAPVDEPGGSQLPTHPSLEDTLRVVYRYVADSEESEFVRGDIYEQYNVDNPLEAAGTVLELFRLLTMDKKGFFKEFNAYVRTQLWDEKV